MKFIESVYEKLRRHPKRIVFPEGDDPRVVRAAQVFYERHGYGRAGLTYRRPLAP